jgi:hypothetical protein
VFNQTYALSLVNDNIQSNMDYLAACVPSNTVLNQDKTKMDTSGFFFSQNLFKLGKIFLNLFLF